MPRPSSCSCTDDGPCRRLAAKLFVAPERLLAFRQYDSFLTELLGSLSRGNPELLVAGHADTTIKRAADQAGLNISELTGTNPFAIEVEGVTSHAVSGREIIYIANPNPLSGAAVGLNGLRRLAEAVPEGALIVNERYFDFYRITGLALTDQLPRVIILRSLTNSPHEHGVAAGLAVTDPARVAAMNNLKGWDRITVLPIEPFGQSDVVCRRVKTVHEQSVRIAECLRQKGLKVRLSATDRMLIPVARPDLVQKHLADEGIFVDDLSDYRGLAGHIRYQVQEPATNDRLVALMGQIPCEETVFSAARRLRLRRPAERRKPDGYRPPVPVFVAKSGIRNEIHHAGGL